MQAKHVRFMLFLDRLRAAPAARTFEEAYQQICDILNAVEDEQTGILPQPEAWESDGRMYPPQMDNERSVDGHPMVRRFRSRAHNTFIGANGSIEIHDLLMPVVVFDKPGADGRSVWNQ